MFNSREFVFINWEEILGKWLEKEENNYDIIERKKKIIEIDLVLL